MTCKHLSIHTTGRYLLLEHPVSIWLPLNLEALLVTGFLQTGGRTISDWFVEGRGARIPVPPVAGRGWKQCGGGQAAVVYPGSTRILSKLEFHCNVSQIYLMAIMS